MKGKKKDKLLLARSLSFNITMYENNYKQINLNTWLYMKFKGDITEEFGNVLPYPQRYFWVNDSTYIYAWNISGAFLTRKGTEHLNEIIARMMITFPTANVVKVKHYHEECEKESTLKLKHFHNLKKIESKILNYEKAQQVECEDQVFWALKLYFEQMIKQNNLSYQSLEDFANNNFIDRVKDRSTLRAKCRSIYNYYCERDFQVFCEYQRKMNDEEYLMTRQQNMKKIAAGKKEDTKRKILNCISGMFKDEYKKPSGSWNIAKIAADTNLHRNTIRNFLNEQEQ